MLRSHVAQAEQNVASITDQLNRALGENNVLRHDARSAGEEISSLHAATALAIKEKTEANTRWASIQFEAISVNPSASCRFTRFSATMGEWTLDRINTCFE